MDRLPENASAIYVELFDDVPDSYSGPGYRAFLGAGYSETSIEEAIREAMGVHDDEVGTGELSANGAEAERETDGVQFEGIEADEAFFDAITAHSTRYPGVRANATDIAGEAVSPEESGKGY